MRPTQLRQPAPVATLYFCCHSVYGVCSRLIFTPMREIPFAGHPIVGTWTALAQEDVVPVPEGGSGWQRIFHEVGIGVLPVDIEFKDGKPVQVEMTQGKFQIISEIDDGHEQAELARALGLAREDLDESLPIQVITTGLPCLAVPVRSLADLRDCEEIINKLNERLARLQGHRDQLLAELQDLTGASSDRFVGAR